MACPRCTRVNCIRVEWSVWPPPSSMLSFFGENAGILEVAKWLSFIYRCQFELAQVDVDDAAVHSQRIIACTQQQCNHGLTNSKRWQLNSSCFFFLFFGFFCDSAASASVCPSGCICCWICADSCFDLMKRPVTGQRGCLFGSHVFFLFFACCSGEFCWVSADSIINSAAAWAKQWSISVFDPWTIYIAWRTTMRGWW